MKKLFLTLLIIFTMTSAVYGGSRNTIEESGSMKFAGEAVSAKLIIEPNNEVATGAFIEIEFENAVVFSANVINGDGTSEDMGFNGRGQGYQYKGYKGYKWNGKDGFYDAMADRPISQVPYKITRLDDYNIRVSLCNIPSEYADKSLAKFNNSADEPYYSISLPVYVKNDGPVRLKITGKNNDSSLSYGNYIFNNGFAKNSTETTTIIEEKATEITTESKNITNKVEVSIGSRVMTVNGENQIIDAAPYIQAGTGSTLIPLRAVSIALADGYSGNGSVNIVSWNGESKTAIINYKDSVIEFTADSNVMKVNGEDKVISGGIPEISNSRMFVPFRVLGEELGVSVDWIAESKAAVFN